MHDPPLILIVDDNRDNRMILDARLASQDYATAQAGDGEEAIEVTRRLVPDLILLDVMMPKLDGFEVTHRLRTDKTLPYIPIILVTAKTALSDVVQGLDAGADDYLTKPVEHAALTARVRAALRVKRLHDQVQAQKTELATWNDVLEQRVATQVGEIERANRLRRFLPSQIAEMVTSDDGSDLLASRHAEITVLFSDLRGFTAYSESAPPDHVMQVLQAYHGVAGPLIEQQHGTLERFLGDGIMVLFNAPVAAPEPCLRAARLAVALRDRFHPAIEPWQVTNNRLGIGIGIAHGIATVGTIGFDDRLDYAAIGPVSNLAARLCDHAAPSEILISDCARQLLAPSVSTEQLNGLSLKGISGAVQAHRLVGISKG
jgi:adenylate cyclase